MHNKRAAFLHIIDQKGILEGQVIKHIVGAYPKHHRVKGGKFVLRYIRYFQVVDRVADGFQVFRNGIPGTHNVTDVLPCFLHLQPYHLDLGRHQHRLGGDMVIGNRNKLAVIGLIPHLHKRAHKPLAAFPGREQAELEVLLIATPFERKRVRCRAHQPSFGGLKAHLSRYLFGV